MNISVDLGYYAFPASLDVPLNHDSASELIGTCNVWDLSFQYAPYVNNYVTLCASLLGIWLEVLVIFYHCLVWSRQPR